METSSKSWRIRITSHNLRSVINYHKDRTDRDPRVTIFRISNSFQLCYGILVKKTDILNWYNLDEEDVYEPRWSEKDRKTVRRESLSFLNDLVCDGSQERCHNFQQIHDLSSRVHTVGTLELEVFDRELNKNRLQVGMDIRQNLHTLTSDVHELKELQLASHGLAMTITNFFMDLKATNLFPNLSSLTGISWSSSSYIDIFRKRIEANFIHIVDASRCRALEHTLFETKIQTLKNQLQEAQKKIEGKSEENRQKLQGNQQLTREQSDQMMQEREAATTRICTLESENSDLKRQIQNIQAIHNKLTEFKQALMNYEQKAREQLDIFIQESDATKARASTLEIENNALKEQLEEARKISSELTEDRQFLIVNEEKTQEQLDKVTQERDAAKSQLKETLRIGTELADREVLQSCENYEPKPHKVQVFELRQTQSIEEKENFINPDQEEDESFIKEEYNISEASAKATRVKHNLIVTRTYL